MPIVKVRVCYLCYQKGELKEADSYYTVQDNEHYDVCEECKKLVEKQGFTTVPIPTEDIVDEL